MYEPEEAAVATPIGLVLIEGDDAVLTRIRFAAIGMPRDSSAKAVREAATQIAAWFAERLVDFDLPLAPASTQRGEALRTTISAIRYGHTASYGALAHVVGSSPRALGQACARNPFPLIVPCHRVLPASGVIGPYSAGEGPPTKRWLLDFEHRQAAISRTG